MWSLARGRLRRGSCIEQRDDLLRRARFAEPRENARDAVRVSLGAPVGHGVDRKHDVIAELMRLARGQLTPKLVAMPAITTWVTPRRLRCASRPVPVNAPQVRLVTV